VTRYAPTLPHASVSGSVQFSPKWRELEAAYGHPLSIGVRQSIREATTDFLDWERFERSAEPLSVATQRIAKLKRAVEALLKVLQQAPTNGTVFADSLVTQHFNKSHIVFPNGDLFSAAPGLLFSIRVACDMAIEEVSRSQGFREGECWDKWIRRLSTIASESGLPSAASKGRVKSKSDYHSPFVFLVEALQSCLPSEVRRHHHSRISLATGIARARRPNRKRGTQLKIDSAKNDPPQKDGAS
jgi:hypothetical protein